MSAEEIVTPSGEEVAVKEPQESPAMEQGENKSSEKIEQLEAQISEMQERMQKQSALIGKLTNEKKPINKIKP